MFSRPSGKGPGPSDRHPGLFPQSSFSSSAQTTGNDLRKVPYVAQSINNSTNPPPQSSSLKQHSKLPPLPPPEQEQLQANRSFSSNNNSREGTGVKRSSTERELPPLPTSTSNRSSTHTARRKPSLGIYIPNFATSAGSYIFGNNTSQNPVGGNLQSTPVKRKPVPGSASSSTVSGDSPEQSRSVQSVRTSQALSNSSSQKSQKSSYNAVVFPPRKSSLVGPLASGNRSASISSQGHSSTAGVELVFRDLDRYPHGSTPPAFSPRRIEETGESLEQTSNSNPLYNNAATNVIPPTSHPSIDSNISTRNDQHIKLHDDAISLSTFPFDTSTTLLQPVAYQASKSLQDQIERSPDQQHLTVYPYSSGPSTPTNAALNSLSFPLPPNASPMASISQTETTSTTTTTTTGLKPIHIGVTAEASKSSETLTPIASTEPPKSPGLMASFFGWKSAAPAAPTADSTDMSSSDSDEPKPPPPLRHAKTMPSKLDIPKANAGGMNVGLGLLTANSLHAPTIPADLPTPPASSSQVADLEDELREISTELAGSIRREMELEDEIDRLRAHCQENHAHAYSASGDSGRRTSDYFSDSGTTSSRYGGTDDQVARIEELERQKRKVELEKAQVKLEMSEKMAEVLKQRRLAEDRISALEEHVQVQSRVMSVATSPAPSPMPRSMEMQKPSMELGTEQQKRWIKNLEMQLEESKRKLSAEQQSRANMEELIGGMRHEIAAYREERDRLQDEVVPMLETRISELERSGGSGVISPRSATISSTRTRNGSVSQEPREQLIQRLKDSEAQGVALHKALRSLLDRHKLTEKSHARRLRAVQTELDKAMVTHRTFGGGQRSINSSARGSAMVLGQRFSSSQNGSLSGREDPNTATSPERSSPPNGGGLRWPGIFMYKSKTKCETSPGMESQHFHQVKPLNTQQTPLLKSPSASNALSTTITSGSYNRDGTGSTPQTATTPKPPTSILDPPGMFRKPAAWLS